MEPPVPNTCTVLSSETDTAVDTRAIRPLGNWRSPDAH